MDPSKRRVLQISGVFLSFWFDDLACLQTDQDIFRHERFGVLTVGIFAGVPCTSSSLPLPSLILLLLPCFLLAVVVAVLCAFKLLWFFVDPVKSPCSCGAWTMAAASLAPTTDTIAPQNACLLRGNGHLVRASEAKSGDAEPAFNRKL